ncbi:DUF4442 domain-containing protein [Croceimicrobium sp.]|uniref:DUF4442 domain-containing protein n=1 Tax=Croceimicrobium sp. TaxID=2828340 RepID=UPI003BA8BC75
MKLSRLFLKAQSSKYHKFLLEQGLRRFVPFNRSHRFQIDQISAHSLRIKAPYRKSNLNHLKGIHACALATIAEISSGLLLIGILDPNKYRIILQKLDLEYHYQAKSEAVARFEVSEDWLQDRVFEPLENSDRVFVDCNINLFDKDDKQIATAIARWQIKNWQSVKTKV